MRQHLRRRTNAFIVPVSGILRARALTQSLVARRLARSVVVTLVLGSGTLLAAQPAQAAQDIGPVNVQVYCQQNFAGTNATVVSPGDAYSWRCYKPQVWYGTNLTQACKQQHVAWPNAYAVTNNPSSPYSWRCMTP